jgi:HSP20 family protein
MSDKSKQELAPRRLFSDFDPFGDFFSAPLLWRRGEASPFPRSSDASLWVPAMDIVEGSDHYTITVELPGASKDDVTVECHENLLTIKGEKRSEREEDEGHHHYTERTYGRFSRSVRLPSDAAEDVEATFKDGVLNVEIPKIEARKPRTVVIGGE